MLIYKVWTARKDGGLRVLQCSGWFLFGFIPLIIWRF